MTEIMWRTYARSSPSPQWIQDLATSNRVRNTLAREHRRLAELVRTERYYGPDAEPIPANELENLRHDLRLWEDPVAVRALLSSHGNYFAGSKTTTEAIAAIDALLAMRAEP